MSRTGGERTRKKILLAAEELFCKNGFHATSVNQITRAAEVNKALVYYYFKDKNDIVVSLFKDIMNELSDAEMRRAQVTSSGKYSEDPGKSLKDEISFLEDKKRILSVMLMEALKTDDQDRSLFQVAEFVMNDHGHEGLKTASETVHEFFTGFIPLIAFVALQDKFRDYFGYDRKKTLDYFVEAFIASHMNSHSKKGGSL